MYKLSLGHVHDLLDVQEGKERIRLRVDADPADIVRVIAKLEPKMSRISTDEEAKAESETICREFCKVIFGEDQTATLFAFYNGDSRHVLSVLSQYIAERLVNKVTKAQKHIKV